MIPLQLVVNIKTDIMSNRVLIFSAPSGSGKSTIVNHILGIYKDQMEFSISATSRAPRGTEQDGKEYYFVTPERFRELIGIKFLIHSTCCSDSIVLRREP